MPSPVEKQWVWVAWGFPKNWKGSPRGNFCCILFKSFFHKNEMRSFGHLWIACYSKRKEKNVPQQSICYKVMLLLKTKQNFFLRIWDWLPFPAWWVWWWLRHGWFQQVSRWSSSYQVQTKTMLRWFKWIALLWWVRYGSVFFKRWDNNYGEGLLGGNSDSKKMAGKWFRGWNEETRVSSSEGTGGPARRARGWLYKFLRAERKKRKFWSNIQIIQ